MSSEDPMARIDRLMAESNADFEFERRARRIADRIIPRMGRNPNGFYEPDAFYASLAGGRDRASLKICDQGDLAGQSARRATTHRASQGQPRGFLIRAHWHCFALSRSGIP